MEEELDSDEELGEKTLINPYILAEKHIPA